MPGDPLSVLILGGTEEARLLAERLAANERLAVTTTLAGVTRKPAPLAGAVHTGGFGGVEGLRAFLEDERIDLLVDATHPFAVQISTNAVDAARAAGIPCLRLERPPWRQRSDDRWILAEDIVSAAEAIPNAARALVTVGRQEVAQFFARKDVIVIARMIEPPEVSVPGNCEIILARPPFAEKDEKELMATKRIDVLVTKNSGGDATVAKISAARELGLPVIVVARPEMPSVPAASSVDEMIVLIAEVLT